MNNEIEIWNSWLNKSIFKKSNKPFKSGNKIGIPINIEINPNSNKLAFRMLDDNSLVDCHQCENYNK